MGVKVTGATCVGSTPTNASQAGFYVVGGKADSSDYSGLQKYTYSTGKWTTIELTDEVTKDRQWHASTYIQADDSILVYAGSQARERNPSTQTFTIQASEPFAVRGYESIAPPAISPTLMGWSAADAAVIGGGTDLLHARVWLFNPTARWRDSGAGLASPLKDATSMQAVLVSGDDGSKCLYTFDLGQSPNRVDRLVLLAANGAPIADAKPVTNSTGAASGTQGKRDLSLDDWPEYNATLAPTVTRKNFAVAQGPNGMVVFSGGNSEQPLAIFDTSKNAWVNATELLGDRTQTVLSEASTTTSVSSTSTSLSPASTSSPPIEGAAATPTTSALAASASESEGSGPGTNVILGITLGSIVGFLALLGLVLLLLRRRARRQKHAESGGQEGHGNGARFSEKDSAGLTKSTKPAKLAGKFRGHYPQASQDSYNSMAILMGRMGKERTGLSRKASDDSMRSLASSERKQLKSTISKPILQTTDQPTFAGVDDRGVAFDPSVDHRPRNDRLEPRDGTRRSSGWNKYWSGGSALQILGFGSGKRNTSTSEHSSHYSEGPSNHSRATQDSATVPPLNFEAHGFEGRPSVNSVNSGSPVVAEFSSKLPAEGLSGKIERPASATSSGYSSGIPESVNDHWDPAEAGKAWRADGAADGSHVPSYYYGATLDADTSAAPQPPSGVSQQPQLSMAATSSDMSWLNLGDQSQSQTCRL
ncbi:hypothetical protein RJ55_05152 [Drechmeria coniospora]|nr:hypothetical protein RJ55_05152 [Drechmeria coniospora]